MRCLKSRFPIGIIVFNEHDSIVEALSFNSRLFPIDCKSSFLNEKYSETTKKVNRFQVDNINPGQCDLKHEAD